MATFWRPRRRSGSRARSTTPRFPSRAIAYCLEEARLAPEQLDYVAFYDKPLTKFERLLETYLSYAPSGWRSFKRGHARVAQEEAVHAPRHPA